MKRLSWGAIFVVYGAIALLTGCSGKQHTSTSTVEGREADSTSSTASPAPADNRPVIVCFGDSLTAGVVETTYPQLLQQILDQHGYKYRVDNQGVAGDTTADGVARMDNVIAEHPAIVLLEFGGNDGLRGVPVDSTRQNLDEMIQKLKASGTQVMLLGITLPPNWGPDYIKPFTAMFPELAKKYDIPLMPFLLINVYQHKDLMQPDGIHPDSAGNKIVAEDVFEFIQPYLKKPQAQ